MLATSSVQKRFAYGSKSDNPDPATGLMKYPDSHLEATLIAPEAVNIFNTARDYSNLTVTLRREHRPDKFENIWT